jgi:hypothetical protein
VFTVTEPWPEELPELDEPLELDELLLELPELLELEELLLELPELLEDELVPLLSPQAARAATIAIAEAPCNTFCPKP